MRRWRHGACWGPPIRATWASCRSIPATFVSAFTRRWQPGAGSPPQRTMGTRITSSVNNAPHRRSKAHGMTSVTPLEAPREQNGATRMLRCSGGLAGMRLTRKWALISLLGWAATTAVAADPSFSDRIEMLDWSDPERAEKIIDSPSLAKGRASEVQFLEVRAMVYVDTRQIG